MVRRNKTLVASSAGIVVALVIGLSLSLFLSIRERRALAEEKAARQRAIAAEKQQALLREQAEKGLVIERRMREMAPLGDKLNQAGMLLSQGLFDKAEEMVKDIPLIIPGSCSIFNVIGDQHARSGQWEQAITNFSRSVQVNPTNHIAYHSLAPLLVVTGDTQGYRRLCERILLEFGTNSDPGIAERMAKDCMILPPEQGSLPTLAKMAETAHSAASASSDWPYYQFVKGFVEYRQGHFRAAAEPLQSVIEQGGEPARTVQAYSVLAMAQHYQHQTEQSRATLAAGRALAQDKLERFQGINWNDRIIAQVLLREATALLESAPGAANGSK